LRTPKIDQFADPQIGQEYARMQAYREVLMTSRSAPMTTLSTMRRLLSPVNVGVTAARHVLWYLSYHAAPRGR
jgi:hypothetical protein